MSLTCNGKLKIKCNKCGHITTIDCEDLPFEVVETDQREMGTESHHSAEYEFDCPNCNDEIKVQYDVWEYPEGVKNHQEIEVDGGTVIEECDVSIQAD